MHESRKNNGAPRQPMQGTPPQEKLTLVQRTRLAKGTPLVSKADMDRETVERFRARQQRMQPPPSWPTIPSKPYGVHPSQVSQPPMVASPISQRPPVGTPALPPKMTSNGLPIRNDYYSRKQISARDRENMPAPTPFPSQPLRKNGGIVPHPNAPQEFHQPAYYPSYSLQKAQEENPNDFIQFQKRSSKNKKTKRQELIDLQFQLGDLLEDAERNGEDPNVVAQLRGQLLQINNILQQGGGPVQPPGRGPGVFSPPPEEKVVMGGLFAGMNLRQIIQQGARVAVVPLEQALQKGVVFAKTPQGIAALGGIAVLTGVAIYLSGEERPSSREFVLLRILADLVDELNELIRIKTERRNRREEIIREIEAVDAIRIQLENDIANSQANLFRDQALIAYELRLRRLEEELERLDELTDLNTAYGRRLIQFIRALVELIGEGKLDKMLTYLRRIGDAITQRFTDAGEAIERLVSTDQILKLMSSLADFFVY